jgi:hypothetical protein
MIQKKPAPDVIRGGNRFSAKIMLQQNVTAGTGRQSGFSRSSAPPASPGAAT